MIVAEISQESFYIVKDPKEKDTYIRLENYLKNTFINKYDRDIEQERIKKLVNR